MRRADREFGELAGGCVCWLFCAPVYGLAGGFGRIGK